MNLSTLVIYLTLVVTIAFAVPTGRHPKSNTPVSALIRNRITCPCQCVPNGTPTTDPVPEGCKSVPCLGSDGAFGRASCSPKELHTGTRQQYPTERSQTSRQSNPKETYKLPDTLRLRGVPERMQTKVSQSGCYCYCRCCDCWVRCSCGRGPAAISS